MSNHKTTYFHAIAKRDNLNRQQRAVSTRKGEFASHRIALEEAQREAIKNLEEVREQSMRELASVEEVSAAKDAAAKVEAALSDLAADERAASNTLDALAGEILNAKNSAAAALDAYCANEAGQIEATLKADKKLRKALTEIYALYSASTDTSLGAQTGGGANWLGILDDIFQEPTQSELDAAAADVKARLQDAR